MKLTTIFLLLCAITFGEVLGVSMLASEHDLCIVDMPLEAESESEKESDKTSKEEVKLIKSGFSLLSAFIDANILKKCVLNRSKICPPYLEIHSPPPEYS